MSDPSQETHDHIARVQDLMNVAVLNLIRRAANHDKSKLEEPEKAAFDGLSGSLKGMAYGSEEYKRTVKEKLADALPHHYAVNTHHPEHFSNGIDGMSLFDLVEMLVDWKAATERMQEGSGSIEHSLEHNTKRFKISPQLRSILENTIKEFGWNKQA